MVSFRLPATNVALSPDFLRRLMKTGNPYHSTGHETINRLPHRQPRSSKRCALIGFGIGAIAPLAFGVYGLQQHYAYVSSLGPNEAACGMGAVSALAMIFVGGPIFGIIGAVSGWIF